MLTVPFILYLIALLLIILGTLNPPRVPLWIPVLLIDIGLLVMVIK